MNDIDDWLNSLGFEPATQPTPPTEPTPSSIEPPSPTEPTTPTPPTPLQELSDSDIDDVLESMGFTELTEFEEIEEEPAPEVAINEEGDLQIQEEIVEEIPEEPAVEESVEQSQPLLPSNSPTLLMNDATSRFSGTEWFNAIQQQRIIFAGIGGIGSNAVFQIARMNPAAIFIYDRDMVERVNMSGQLFSQEDIGKFKVTAIADMVLRYTSCEHVYANNYWYSETCDATDIMMCGFDSMSARRTFFEKWHEHVRGESIEDRKNCLYLDGRLSIDTLQIFCIRGDDTYNIDRYDHEFLFTDEQADETICSMKQTTYLACMIGSMMTNLFVNFVANSLDPVIPYDLPFFTEYDAQNMIFKTEN